MRSAMHAQQSWLMVAHPPASCRDPGIIANNSPGFADTLQVHWHLQLMQQWHCALSRRAALLCGCDPRACRDADGEMQVAFKSAKSSEQCKKISNYVCSVQLVFLSHPFSFLLNDDEWRRVFVHVFKFIKRGKQIDGTSLWWNTFL